MKEHLSIPGQELLEKIFLQSTNVIAITNADFNNLSFTYVNPAFLEMTGYTLNEVIGKNPKILQGPLTKREMINKLKESCLKGEAFRGDNINYKKDGNIYYVRWTVTPIKDNFGNIVNFLSIQEDITQIKQMEKEALELEKLSALSKIASGLTHEINTSITSCSGSIEMLGYDVQEIKDEKLKEYMSQDIDKMKQSLDNVKYITNTLHYLTNKEFIILPDQAVSTVILDAIFKHKDKILKTTQCTVNGISVFDENFILDKFTCNIDAVAMMHVFMNIIDNALDELVKVDHVETNQFNIEIFKENVNTVIIFKDNAGGIDPAKIQKIFDPLFKDKEHGGLGLGLYIVKKIIEAHNGTIDAESKNGITSFKIVLK